jgi:hypothetical protein
MKSGSDGVDEMIMSWIVIEGLESAALAMRLAEGEVSSSSGRLRLELWRPELIES